MIIRYQVWRSRGRAKHLSRHSRITIVALVNGVTVGKFFHGKEVKHA